MYNIIRCPQCLNETFTPPGRCVKCDAYRFDWIQDKGSDTTKEVGNEIAGSE